MLRSLLLSGLLMISLEMVSQSYPLCRCLPFAYYFLSIHVQPERLIIFHYTEDHEYKPSKEEMTWNQNYQYLHNGDNLKGARDLFRGADAQGSELFKYLDVGKFLTILIEPGAYSHEKSGGCYTYSSNLAFFTLVKKKKFKSS